MKFDINEESKIAELNSTITLNNMKSQFPCKNTNINNKINIDTNKENLLTTFNSIYANNKNNCPDSDEEDFKFYNAKTRDCSNKISYKYISDKENINNW